MNNDIYERMRIILSLKLIEEVKLLNKLTEENKRENIEKKKKNNEKEKQYIYGIETIGGQNYDDHHIKYKNDINDYKVEMKYIYIELELVLRKDLTGIVLKYIKINPENDIIRKIYIEGLKQYKYWNKAFSINGKWKNQFSIKDFLKNYKLKTNEYMKIYDHLYCSGLNPNNS